jgi:uncharacterized integral membrane protein
MARDNRPAHDTTADPAVPGIAQYEDEPYDGGQPGTQRVPGRLPAEAAPPAGPGPDGLEPDGSAPPATPAPDGAQPDVAAPGAGQRGEIEPAPGQPGPGQPAPGQPGPPPTRGPGSAGHALERTRLGATWVAIGAFAVVLLLLLVFILENTHSVSVSFFGAHGSLPLGVALVLAALCGVLLVMAAGAARILQIRSRVRKHRRSERKASKAAARAAKAAQSS